MSEKVTQYVLCYFIIPTKPFLIKNGLVPEYNVQYIKTIRKRLGMSRKELSILLGVSKKTVDAWERGVNIPSGTAKRLMQLINDDSEFVVDRLTHHELSGTKKDRESVRM
ncbi:helix-turn-helix domain-containing protein [Macrococcus armenti]|uniref:helix-turn-helix domain-containing protein n=1 Tax=Macrococcus armenti TaxID=2875764 RepID=UPI001CCFB892|nr:helix-turn-helix domain-containing protein [Macrococcus armenti]UBH14414.1 helix-turn-helix domain-containing protein [Macrococcus armenti]UBH16774.1 helix-turn-helix domain-containing protein [Macrococcus armenti]UBH19037.1 helix-turn-helix domain-containing protein [Macrococcus armenti]